MFGRRQAAKLLSICFSYLFRIWSDRSISEAIFGNGCPRQGLPSGHVARFPARSAGHAVMAAAHLLLIFRALPNSESVCERTRGLCITSDRLLQQTARFHGGLVQLFASPSRRSDRPDRPLPLITQAVSRFSSPRASVQKVTPPYSRSLPFPSRMNPSAFLACAFCRAGSSVVGSANDFPSGRHAVPVSSAPHPM